MKYTIYGFSQERALEFRQEVEKNGKKSVVVLDVIDLAILRWFVDFFPCMMKKHLNGEEYAWVKYESLSEDIPFLRLEKKAIYKRFRKMCDFGILKHEHVKDGGSFSYYGFGENYARLISSTENYEKPRNDSNKNIQGGNNGHKGLNQALVGGDAECSKGVVTVGANKDPSTKYNSSTKYDKSTKYNIQEREKTNKKERTDDVLFADKKSEKQKSTTKADKRASQPESLDYDAIVNGFTEDAELQRAIFEYIKMRQLIKSPLTNRALELALKKAQELEPSSANQIKIFEQSTLNGWRGIFPLGEQETRHLTKSGTDGSEYAEFD